jgi:DNA-binding XRE family transcriptional regulator
MFHRRKRWEHSLDPRDTAEQRGYDAIGAALKERRVAAGLTQRDLEALTGVDQTVISRLENGKQYGLRWSRYAILVAVLDERQGSRLETQPWWATLGKSPRPNSSPADDAITP